MKEYIQSIIRTPLEDVMHDSFMPYAEYVILERAIPRVEDGLKPVQRHILFAMHEMQVLPSGAHKKCARIVGETMGKYHPHGDSSIYEALARMAQDFSMNEPLIDGQGNFGSIDGDGPAAMRYTEARLAPISLELLRDLDKNTVPFQFNFDDTLKEPVILPSRFPNLLVNGATGIAVGIATNIPPHNLREVIDAAILRINDPSSTLSDVMRYVKGPDFPTGGSILARQDIREAYETGRGKITLRAKVQIEKGRSGRAQIVVTELPYEIREANMLRKIQLLRATKKEMFAGIYDVRSETDRTGLRAVIELKSGVDAETVLDCLYKYSDLQITYGVNMMAIAEGQPRQLGLIELIDYYVAHQKKVVYNRVLFDKEAAEERAHKLEGLRIAVLNIDLVIKIIRGSDNVRIAKAELMKQLSVSGVQAQTILDLRLARLTRLEVLTIEQEYSETMKLLEELTQVLKSGRKLNELIVKELGEISAKYGHKRRTSISSESAEISIDEDAFRQVEESVVILTRSGNLKRMSKKALTKGAENGEPEPKNQSVKMLEVLSGDRLWLFTNLGNLYTLNTDDVKEAKYKDPGSSIHSIMAGFEKEEEIVSMLSPAGGRLLTVSEQGKVKFSDMSELETRRSKISACGLGEKDRLLFALPDEPDKKNLLLITKKGFSICFSKEEISLQGKAAKGVGGISLGAGDGVILAVQTNGSETAALFTDNGYAKLMRMDAFELQSRNGKGAKCISFLKNKANGTGLFAAFLIEGTSTFEALSDKGNLYGLSSSKMPMQDKAGSGQQLIPLMSGEKLQKIWVK